MNRIDRKKYKIIEQKILSQDEFLGELSRQQAEIDALVEHIEQQIMNTPAEDGTIDYVKMKAESEQLIRKCDEIIYHNYVDNQIISALLHHKHKKCVEAGIEFSFEMQAPKKVEIEEVDLVGLMGNLLDNAIEANQKIVNAHKYIKITSMEQAGVWSIKIENAKISKESAQKQNFKTTKEDKINHGFGMKNMKRIVDKYDGTMNIKEEKESFCVLISI